MHDVVGDAGRGHLLAVLAGRPAIGHVLDDLDDVAVGILHVEVLVAGLAFADRALVAHDLDALGLQIGVHLVGVVGIEGDVVELAFAAIGLVEDFEILVVVDLDEQDADTGAAAFGRKGERLLVAEEILIELAGLVEVFDVDRQVRDAENLGALHGVGRRRGPEDRTCNHHGAEQNPGQTRPGIHAVSLQHAA